MKTKALILAAGNARRMLPLTENMPKCLLQVGPKTILAHQLDTIIGCGIHDVILVIGYYGEQIINFIHSNEYQDKAEFTFIWNEKFAETGSCYSMWCAREEMNDGYVHFNADLLFDDQVLAILLKSDRKDAVITDTFRTETLDMVRYSTVNGRIARVGRPHQVDNAAGVLVGPIKFSSESTKIFLNEINLEIQQGQMKNNCYLVLDKILDRIKLYPLPCKQLRWQEFDTVEELSNYQNGI